MRPRQRNWLCGHVKVAGNTFTPRELATQSPPDSLSLGYQLLRINNLKMASIPLKVFLNLTFLPFFATPLLTGFFTLQQNILRTSYTMRYTHLLAALTAAHITAAKPVAKLPGEDGINNVDDNNIPHSTDPPSGGSNGQPLKNPNHNLQAGASTVPYSDGLTLGQG